MKRKFSRLLIICLAFITISGCSTASILTTAGSYGASMVLGGLGSMVSMGANAVRKTPRIRRSTDACMSDLIAQGVSFSIIPNDQKGQCVVQNQLVLDRSLFPYTGTGQVKGQCEMISALHKWEKDVVQPAAARYLNSRVVKVREMGTYSCRNIAGSRYRSQHSYANAIDIGGFYMENGRHIDVEKDWGKRTAEAQFLAAVHRNSCRIFSTVLGPNYNYDHRNHFHLDMGPHRTCK